MGFDPRRLAVLRAVAAHRSFTAAADALVTTQPAVSRQIAALERELAVQLVVRGPRHVTLTPAGEALVAHAETLLPAIDAAAREMGAYAAPDGGSVRLGAVPSAMASIVPDALVALRARRPRVMIEADEGWTDDLLRRVDRGDLDLAVVSGPAADEPGDRTLLAAEPFVVLLARGHRLARRTALALADLRDEAWIVAPSPGVRGELVAACARAGFAPEIVATASWGAARRLVGAGLGVALPPASAAGRTPGVAVRPLSEPPRRSLVLVRAPRARRTGAERDLEATLVAAAATGL
jgi:DNA-binding transcriptional LysR family regulator